VKLITFLTETAGYGLLGIPTGKRKLTPRRASDARNQKIEWESHRIPNPLGEKEKGGGQGVGGPKWTRDCESDRIDSRHKGTEP